MIRIKYCDKLIVECDTASEAAQLINKNIRGKDGFDKIVMPCDLKENSYFIRLTGKTPYKMISPNSVHGFKLTSNPQHLRHCDNNIRDGLVFGVSTTNGNISHVNADEFVFELTAKEALEYDNN